MRFKFVLHSTARFLAKYRELGEHFEKTFAFSPAETIAGIETLLEVFVHQKELISGSVRPSPGEVAALINQWNVDFFQTTPSFMNLMVAAKVISDMKCLKKIAYGSEPSQKAILQQFQKQLPGLEFMHTYGMTEIGILKTITDQLNPTFFIFDKTFNDFQVLDGKLQVVSKTPMVGYLNVSGPVPCGWFATGDMIKLEGAYLQVTGKDSEMLFELSLKNSETPWNQWLKLHRHRFEHSQDYCLKPLTRFWSAAPFIVASYDRTAELLKSYASAGHGFFMLDYHPDDVSHVAEVLRRYHKL